MLHRAGWLRARELKCRGVVAKEAGGRFPGQLPASDPRAQPSLKKLI